MQEMKNILNSQDDFAWPFQSTVVFWLSNLFIIWLFWFEILLEQAGHNGHLSKLLKYFLRSSSGFRNSVCVFGIWQKRKYLGERGAQTHTYVMLCAIWYHLCNSKKMKNTRGRVLLLVELQAETCNFTKSSTPPWVFLMFFFNFANGTKCAKRLICLIGGEKGKQNFQNAYLQLEWFPSGEKEKTRKAIFCKEKISNFIKQYFYPSILQIIILT